MCPYGGIVIHGGGEGLRRASPRLTFRNLFQEPRSVGEATLLNGEMDAKNVTLSPMSILEHKLVSGRFQGVDIGYGWFHFCLLHVAFCLALPAPTHCLQLAKIPLPPRLAGPPLPQGGEGKRFVNFQLARYFGHH